MKTSDAFINTIWAKLYWRLVPLVKDYASIMVLSGLLSDVQKLLMNASL